MTSKKKLKRKVAYWRAHARAYLDECRDVYRDLFDYMNYVRPEPATRADDDRLEASLRARYEISELLSKSEFIELTDGRIVIHDAH